MSVYAYEQGYPQACLDTYMDFHTYEKLHHFPTRKNLEPRFASRKIKIKSSMKKEGKDNEYILYFIKENEYFLYIIYFTLLKIMNNDFFFIFNVLPWDLIIQNSCAKQLLRPVLFYI